MNKLIIVGAGGFGREVLQWALQSSAYNVHWEIAGFLDDDLSKLQGFECAYPILGKIADWQPKVDERFVLAVGASKDKEKIATLLAKRNAVFVNIIHPSVVITATARLGKGVILCPGVVISNHTVIADHVSVNINSCIGHDAVIGEYTTINSLCDITGNVVVGKGVFIGSSVSVIPSCRVGDGAYLCAGSVVMNDIPQNTRVFGVPAKKFMIKTGTDHD